MQFSLSAVALFKKIIAETLMRDLAGICRGKTPPFTPKV